jgi:hypothetical protein
MSEALARPGTVLPGLLRAVVVLTVVLVVAAAGQQSDDRGHQGGQVASCFDDGSPELHGVLPQVIGWRVSRPVLPLAGPTEPARMFVRHG